MLKRNYSELVSLNKNKKAVGGLSVTFLLLASTSLAGVDLSENKPIEEITVTANRISGTLSEIGSSVEVITAEDIANTQEFSVADLLRQAAGVSLSRNGGLGGVTNVRLRGAEAGQAVVLINGIKVNDLSAPSGGYNFANIFSGDVEQIEVLKGPQSTLYGSDAMAGVISINTKPTLAENGVRFNAYGELGSFDTQRTGASAAFKHNKISGFFNVSYVRSDGISAADENDGNTETDPYKNLTLSGNLSFSLVENENTNIVLETFARLSNADISFDSFDFIAGFVDGDETEEVDDQQFGFKGRFNLLSGKFKNSFTANWSDIDRHDFIGGEKSFDAFSRRENYEYLAEVAPTQYLTVLLGGEVENNNIITESFGPWGSRVEGDADIESVFAELKLHEQAGLTMTFGVRHDNHATFGGNTSLRTTLVYNFAHMGTLVRANFGEGFRAPSLFQLFSSFGDATLRPEASEGWEVGFEQKFGTADSYSVAATYFVTNTENQINFDLGTFKYANLDKTTVKGVEVKANAELSEKLILSANYTYMDAKDVTLGAPLLRRPENSYNVQAHYAWSEALSNTLTLSHVGEQPDVGGTLAGYTVVDLMGAWQFHESSELYARVENLFDKEYQEVTAFGTPDRSIYVGLRIKM